MDRLRSFSHPIRMDCFEEEQNEEIILIYAVAVIPMNPQDGP